MFLVPDDGDERKEDDDALALQDEEDDEKEKMEMEGGAVNGDYVLRSEGGDLGKEEPIKGRKAAPPVVVVGGRSVVETPCVNSNTTFVCFVPRLTRPPP